MHETYLLNIIKIYDITGRPSPRVCTEFLSKSIDDRCIWSHVEHQIMPKGYDS